MTLTARGELRRGATVLAGSMLGLGTGVSGLLLYTNGLFVAGLTHDFGLTRTAFGLGVLAVTIALAIANPMVGWAIDRFGARPIAAGGLIALALGFAGLATGVRSVPSYIAIQALTALFAAASGPIAYAKIVSGWFHRRRGLALGILLTGIGLAAAIVPPLAARVIAQHGWQAGYWLLAGVALTGLLPVALLVRPAPASEDGSATLASDETGVPVFADPFRSRAFWTMTAAFFAMALSFAGLLPHFVPLLIDKGVSPVTAGGFAGIIGLAVIGSRVVVGMLVDRFFAPLVAIGVCVVAMLGCLTLLGSAAAGVTVAALAIGCAMGGEVDLISFLVARYFGMAHFGRIYGWQYATFILGSGFGPLWVGAVHDRTGSYDVPLLMCIAGLLLTCALLALLPRYPWHVARDDRKETR